MHKKISRPDFYSKTKDGREVFIEVKPFAESIKIVDTLFGNPARRTLIEYLCKKEMANKYKLYEMLKDSGIDITYTNTLWNLNKLRDEGFVTFKRVKEEYNSAYVILNKGHVKGEVDKAVKELSKFKELLH